MRPMAPVSSRERADVGFPQDRIYHADFRASGQLNRSMNIAPELSH
eukprot:COSAG06_NODE_41495_length_390_cov_168.151203_1_plen_45_part_10